MVIRCWLHNLKEVVVYSDTRHLELLIVVVNILVNPVTEDYFFMPVWWGNVGILAGVLLLYGILENCKKIRSWGLTACLCMCTCGLGYTLYLQGISMASVTSAIGLILQVGYTLLCYLRLTKEISHMERKYGSQ